MVILINNHHFKDGMLIKVQINQLNKMENYMAEGLLMMDIALIHLCLQSRLFKNKVSPFQVKINIIVGIVMVTEGD
jgi:hypothetical protein